MFGRNPRCYFLAEDEIMNVKPEKGETQKAISMNKMKSKPAMSWPTRRLFLFYLFFLSFSFSSVIFFFVYSDSVIGNFCRVSPSSDRLLRPSLEQTSDLHYQTNLSHVVFGIAGSSKLWEHRKNYIKQWWRGDVMRGNVWLDVPVNVTEDEVKFFPPVRVSGDTSEFNYTHPFGHRSAIRISRIVSESLRLGMENVRWFVMGDDDTFFIVDNLIRVLQKYDHAQFYYIGSSSESHIQNMEFSYNMAYGGGGFAISYPLAKELAKMQDRCIQRHPELYGSDDRLQACMAELGVPLTKELGFHQCDIYGNLFGILTAHPITPVVTLHHLDIVDPIFPDLNQTEALQRLSSAIKLDSAGLLQQSICYDRSRTWTISVAWGYAVQIFRGIFTARELDMPARTFLNWYRESGYKAHAFNSRPFSRTACQKPTLYYFDDAVLEEDGNRTVSQYSQFQTLSPECDWSISDPSQIDRIEVYRKPDPFKWEKSPRRDCCRVLSTVKENTLVIDLGPCDEDEVIEF